MARVHGDREPSAGEGRGGERQRRVRLDVGIDARQQLLRLLEATLAGA